MIEAGGIAEPDRIGGREQAEPGIGADHPILVEQGQLAFGLEHPLDDEHHIGTPGIIFVEYQSHRMLQRPWQQAFAEFGDLLTVLQHDRVTPHQVDSANVRVKVDPHRRPVQSRRYLFDMG